MVDLNETVQGAREAVVRERAKLAEWEAKVAAATAELASLQERAGVDVLERPDDEAQVAAAITELRGRVDVAERAVAAQRPRVLIAERRYLAAEADRLEEPAREAEARLAAHESRTKRLLALLERHEGPFVPETEKIALIRQLQMATGAAWERMSWTRPKSEVLREDLEGQLRQVEVLRILAAGDDPTATVAAWGASASQVYPACVYGPDALVPAEEYLRSLRHARWLVEELEQLEERLPGEAAEWRLRQVMARPGENLEGYERTRQRLDTLPEDLERARAALAELTT